jgi:hypothetical protein
MMMAAITTMFGMVGFVLMMVLQMVVPAHAGSNCYNCHSVQTVCHFTGTTQNTIYGYCNNTFNILGVKKEKGVYNVVSIEDSGSDPQAFLMGDITFTSSRMKYHYISDGDLATMDLTHDDIQGSCEMIPWDETICDF